MPTLHDECYSCSHKRRITLETHVTCIKPDPKMIGEQYGIERGWFRYPLLFDPVWKRKLCDNFTEAA